MGQDPAGDAGQQEPVPGWQAPSGDYSPPPSYAPPPGYAPPPSYAPPPGYGPPGYAAPPSFGSAPPLADKPGVIPLRPLAVGEILDGVFTAIRSNPLALLGLSFIVVLLEQLVVTGFNIGFSGASAGARLTVSFGTILIQQLATTIVSGVAIIVIGEAVLGTRVSVGDTLGRLRGRAWRLLGLSLLVSLLTLLGTVLFFIPGIYVAVLFSFAAPVFILEKSKVRPALSRSAELVRGSWWRTFGIGFLGYLVAGVISAVIEVPFLIATAHSSGLFSTPAASISTSGQLVLAVGRVLSGTLGTPITAGTIALLYVDRRMRREGLDLVLARAARERQGRS